ncbi:FAD-binding and (Fe-S)-binding domain-containing protein [Cellulomonas chengniuliangii]|uniref:FAD-binding oxidoreductase n=1 Tax=Cellulomonas chengniuliangii TaxID=2968084 RepID=A0ABY5L1K2_9CELL|nr:FAD-binding and (Fe-S)-binding domain-containing protein [Cellulomonas chengniuliangii]MCC2307394.1 FAD-binding oxidoreductase [Cellulomonas chengniuliangii]MCC2318003.1 FAD-binding oxidoreductase [Cellulomonas chengniuliangii]UUI75825.1 FAD-binding oxidoreductase [Cellulomonas chengniuliangii]
MSTVTTPAPREHQPAADLVHALRAVVRGPVDDSTRRRAEYSTDASNYRVPPQVVVFPRDVDDVLATLDVAREAGAPLTARGGGTSVAGNAVGPGIVIDFSRSVNRVLEIDPEARTARIEPGVIMTELQRQAAPFGLRFGPDPSTQARATLGGMIGNNACGPRAVAYGRTADNVVALDVVDGLGRRFTAGKGLDPVPGLDELVRRELETLRTELGRFGRQVSGYSLEHLLPERGADLAKALVGSEGTLVTIVGATVNLVPVPAAPVLVVLGYPDMPTAADAVPALLEHQPLAIEGMDARLVDVVRRVRGASAVPHLPSGGGWLMVEVGGPTLDEALDNARALAADAATDAVQVYPPGPEAAAMWRIREDGAGLGGRTPAGEQAWPGFEDSAVPPARLGAYLRELEALMASHGVDGLAYGHFGDGCVHLRLDVPLERSGDPLRAFMTDAAHLVAAHGGSLSGEHGDGRARSELLPVMYSARAIEAFGAMKSLLDPRDLLNPGVLVRPRPLDADLRRPAARPLPALVGRDGGFAFEHDAGDLTTAVHRCVGVGKCRADTSASGGFMCPSYLATRDEKDSTRGRARVLQELANGTLITRGWSAPEVEQSLDLCLSCKACSSDCPAGVDMAQYKSEVLFRKYRRRVRPVTHYLLGWLPRWIRLVTSVPGLAQVANGALRWRPLAKVVLGAGGMDTRRRMVTFAPTPFRTWWRREQRRAGAVAGGQTAGGSPRPKVLLWTDSFSDSLSPSVPQAAVRVLRAAGYDVLVPEAEACCGLTWITTGQLPAARKKLTELLGVLGPYAVNGIPIVGLEPSCTAVLRSDLLDLLPDDPRAVAVSRQTHTLAELLMAPAPIGPDPESGWTLPDLSDVTAVVQPHCHHHSVMTYTADRTLLSEAGATFRTLAGCCGLAGNFGMEKGHYDVSVAVAEHELLPALREAGPQDVFLADGFSCRTQADHLADVHGVHLAELLAAHLPATER